MNDDIIVKFDGFPIAEINSKQEDIIVFKYKTDIEMEYLAHVYSKIKDEFPNNTVVAIPESSCLEVLPKEQLIAQLKDMIKMLEEKIK